MKVAQINHQQSFGSMKIGLKEQEKLNKFVNKQLTNMNTRIRWAKKIEALKESDAVQLLVNNKEQVFVVNNGAIHTITTKNGKLEGKFMKALQTAFEFLPKKK